MSLFPGKLHFLQLYSPSLEQLFATLSPVPFDIRRKHPFLAALKWSHWAQYEEEYDELKLLHRFLPDDGLKFE